MFKTLAAASVAISATSAINIEKKWVSYDLAPIKDEYAGSTVSPAYDGKIKAAYNLKKQRNNIWVPRRTQAYLDRFRG